MSGREPPRLADPDDWFADPADPATPRRGSTRVSEAPARLRPGSGRDHQWIDEESAGTRIGAFTSGNLGISPRVALAAAVVLLGLILAGLVLAGAFSGTGKNRGTSPPPPASASTTNRSPSTTQTTPARPTRQVLRVPTTTLKPGDNNGQVKRLQRALARLGYPAGAADGAYGSATRAALTHFQQASGLAADGVLGPKTLEALKKALQRTS